MQKALILAAVLGLVAAQAPAQAPTGGNGGIGAITTQLTCPTSGVPVFTPADPTNINTTYTAAITWAAIINSPNFVAPNAPCNPANYTAASQVLSACSTPVLQGYVVIFQFNVVLACGASTTVNANIYVGAGSSDGQVLLRNYTTSGWANNPVPVPSPVVAPSPKVPASPAPGASPAIVVPTNETFTLSCPAATNASTAFLAAPLNDANTLITAEASYDAIIALAQYPGVPAQCNINNNTVVAVREACAKTINEGYIAILSYNISLSCGISANVSVNVFVYNVTGQVFLRNFTHGAWTPIAAPPSPPPPSPTPPPVCTFGVPFCRVYTEDVMCCKDQGFVTPANHATVRLVCSEFAPPPSESCWTVSGPSNFSVISTDFGTYFEGRRYLINWTADSNYTGPVRIGLNQTAPQCKLTLAQGPCQVNGVAYSAAVQTNDTIINAIPDTGVYFSYLSNAADLKYLDNMGWMNTQNNQSGCLMNTPNNLPASFYVRGWINYTTGIQANCTSGPGATCTALAPAPAPATTAGNIVGRRLL